VSRMSRRRAGWPAGLLGMLCLVGVIELGLARRGRDFTTIWATAWARRDSDARREAPRSEILFFGDSLVMEGVAPQVVAQRLGRPATNLAIFKGLAPASYALLRRALDAGARPAAVLIDGELLGDEPRELTRLWPELLTIGEAADLAWTARDADLFAEVALGRMLPSLRARHEIREAILAALQGQDTPVRHILAQHVRNWRRNGGAHIQSADITPAPETISGLIASNYLPAGWQAHPINAAYIEKFLTLAESRGIATFWLMPPAHPEVQARRDRGGLSAAYEKYVRELVVRHPTLVVLDGRHAGFPHEAMADLTHLNRDGAVAFSERVADALRTRLSDGGRIKGVSETRRWIALALYHAPRENVAEVEDLRQSADALRRAARERRVAPETRRR
jgi:hypothetical protein